MTSLAEIRDGTSQGLDQNQVRTKPGLVRELQQRLADLGLLDPPVDGDFGPVSQWAWREFCRLVGAGDSDRLTADLARALLSQRRDDLLPLDVAGSSLAARIVRSMQQLGYWFCAHPDCANIVYLEGRNQDGAVNANKVDEYNDLRCVIAVRERVPIMIGAWRATTQPGWHAILNPVPGIRDPVKAAAHIALGQYKAWGVGLHKGAYEALVQRRKLRVHRDQDRNGLRDGDPVFERADYGINQHHGNNSSKVGKYSAGCLVASSIAEHQEFMSLVKQDARFRESNHYAFMTAIISQDQLQD